MTSLPELDAAGLAAALAEQKDGLLLVDFFAQNCVWCERLEPVLAAAVDAWAGKVRMVKINAVLHPEVLPSGGIRGTPTVALYRGGAFIMMKTGMIQRGALDAFLEHWLDPANTGLAEGS